MAINYASAYSNVVDERFSQESVTQGIGFNKNYKFTGVKTLTIYDVPTVPMNDYQKSGTSRYGTLEDLQDDKEDYTMMKDRSFTYGIDEGDSLSQMEIKKREGASLSRQIREVITPEIDIYRLNLMHTTAVAKGQTVSGTSLTKSNAYEKFLAMQEKLDDALVPVRGRITFVTPAYYNLLKQDPSFIKNGDLSQKILLNGQVGEVDGNKIIKVPTQYLPSGCSAITIYPKCMMVPEKLKDYIKHVNPQGYNGIVVEGRIMYDAFVLKSKAKAISAITTVESV